MIWRIKGAERGTGNDVTIFVSADTAAEAENSPQARTMYVSSVAVEGPDIPPLPSNPEPFDWRKEKGDFIAAARKGQRLEIPSRQELIFAGFYLFVGFFIASLIISIVGWILIEIVKFITSNMRP